MGTVKSDDAKLSNNALDLSRCLSFSVLTYICNNR